MDETDVLHYDLEIEITEIEPLDANCWISGRNTMTVRSRSASLDEFTFRLRTQFDVLGAYVNESTPVTVTTPPPPNTATRIVTLDRTYGMDETFTLTIEYAGRTLSLGFGSIRVSTHSGGIPVVATLSEPYYAHTWWPAKDGDVFQPGDNSDKATMELAVTVPDNFLVPSNGLLLGEEPLSGNRKRCRWASSYPIATYLVSFAATEYNTWTVMYDHPGGSMPVEFYIYDSNDTPANRAAWEESVDMLAAFSDLFGQYPFVDEKYGIYNFPFNGGMEHQTITGQSGFSEWLTAHELAHQWWGDAVTCRTWNHVWLNEGFATYAEALWVEHEPGSTGLPALKTYMANKKYVGSGTVYVPDDQVDSLGRIFSSWTSYRKGAWVLHMLRHVLGDDGFFDALAAYRAAFEDSAATTEDFQAVCESFYHGAGLDWFFQEWIYGEYVPTYWWGWDAVEIDGQHYLLLSIDQIQYQTYQRFTMPIDIVVDGQTHVVFNDTDPQYFVIPVAAAPTTVALDPDEWILRNDTIEREYVPGPPVIVETTPAPGVVIPYLDAVEAIAVTFHTDVKVGGGGISLLGAETGPWNFSVMPGADTRHLVLHLPYPLLPDRYKLIIKDTIEAADSLLPLDGEVANPFDASSLPSGNGVPGGAALIQFDVLSSFTPGEFDGIPGLSLADFQVFETCMTGPAGPFADPECHPADFDLSSIVDLADVQVLQVVFPRS